MGLDLTIISNHPYTGNLESLMYKVQNKLNFEYRDSELSDFFKPASREDEYREWIKSSWRFDLMGLKSLKEVII